MKRYLIALLCIALMLGSARAAVSIRMDGSAALLDEDGTEIVAAGEYGDIVSLGGGLFAAERDGLYALMGEDGGLRTEAVFSEMRIAGKLILARRDGKWGQLYPDGSERCPFEYSLILPSVSQNSWALRGDPNDMESDKLYRIDAQGRQHATRLYVRAMSRTAAGGLLGIVLRGSSQYGYCSALGEIAIAPAFDYAGDFVNGLAPVVTGGRYGAIDRKGRLVVPAEYDFLEIGEAGIVIAAKSRIGVYVFDMNGVETARYEGEDVYIASVGEGYAVVNSEFLYVYGRDGSLLLEAPPESIVLEGVNGQLIISDGMWGEECVYLNGTREKYQNLYPLGTADGEAIYACMTANVGRYVNDLLGEIQLSTDMDSARYGVVGAEGTMLTECVYYSLDYLADDRLLARTAEAWQMIDSRGNVLWEHAAPMQTEESSF